MENLPGNINLPTSQTEFDEYIALGEQKHKYSVEDFFRNPEKSAFSLSPDGQFLAFLGPYERRKNIFIQKINSSDIQQITKEVDRDIESFGWVNDNRLIYLKDSGGDENFKLYAVDKDGANLKNLTPFDKVTIQILDILETSDDEIIIGLNKNNPQLFEPYKLNIETGELMQLAHNTNVMEPIVHWQTDHDGQLRLAMRMRNGVENILMYRATENEDFRDVIETNFKESLSPLFFDFVNPNEIYMSSNLNRDKQVIVKVDLNTGKEIGEVIYSHPEVDVTGLGYSKKRKVLTSISYVTDKKERVFLDEKTKKIFQFLEKELSPQVFNISSYNRAEDKFLIRTYSDTSLGAYYFYDALDNTLIKLHDVSPWLDASDLSMMKPISYSSRDGLTIHGYLSLPKNGQKKLPIIIHPHGGPWVRDQWGYNPVVQLFCHHGYGVLQMNYRGSTGYGRAFWEKSFGEWGKAMQNDITDGVSWLIREGVADPDRIAIFGGSYGGYATLAGITFTPELYKCAIDYVGVSNLFTFMKTIPPYWKPYLEMMYEMVGHPEEDKEDMIARSPVFHIEQIKCPLLVIQGANDPRVNIDESDQIVEKLRSKGVEVPYLVKYDEGHGFRNEENRIEGYKIILGFLKKHL